MNLAPIVRWKKLMRLRITYLHLWDCGSMLEWLIWVERTPRLIPGDYQWYILLLWIFREPIVAIRIKKKHACCILPVAAINIGTLVPIFFKSLTWHFSNPNSCLLAVFRNCQVKSNPTNWPNSNNPSGQVLPLKQRCFYYLADLAMMHSDRKKLQSHQI